MAFLPSVKMPKVPPSKGQKGQDVHKVTTPIEKLVGEEGLLRFAQIAEGVDMTTGEPFKFGQGEWAWQLDVLRRFYRERRLVILKARQLGVTWLAALYTLWKALVYPYTRTLIVSRNREQASMTLRNYVGELYRRLPKALQVGTVSEQAFLMRFKNGSEIVTQPSTEDAGRGFTGALAIMDEAAYQPYAELTYLSLKPAVDNGGQLIVFSTAKGVGGFFHRLWEESVAGQNGFAYLFLPYHLHPHRDEAWREQQRREFLEEWMLAQEYPATVEEAFVLSGRPVFNPITLQRLRQEAKEPIQTPPDLALLDPYIQVFAEPEAGHFYIVGVDCAEGLIHGDLNAICVIDGLTGEQVAEYASRVEAFTFAEHVNIVARYYQAAEVIVERNGIGAAVLLKLRHINPQLRLYRDQTVRRRFTIHSVYGWQTTVKTKPLLINALQEGLHFGRLRPNSKDVLDEMVHYQRDEDGSTHAAPGHTDDRLMAMALAWYRTRELQLRREKVGDLPSYFYYNPPTETEGMYSWLREAMKEWEEAQRRGQLIRPLSEVLGESAL
jgi:hypothetical protein